MRCGAFVALPQEDGWWEITCSRLPEWRQRVRGKELEISDAIMRLQAHFRDSWAEEKAK
jgi:hypothetical protein